jgi:hypothetical protein
MLSEKSHLENTDNEQMNNSIHEMANNGQNIPQGFNVFMQYGFTQDEIRGLRMIYHLSALRNSIANGRNLDLSLNAMYQRENNWLRNSHNNNNGINNRGRNVVRIQINNNGFGRRRYIRIYRNEPNISFFQGLMFGIILNIFSLFILMIVRHRPKFKMGLIFGMIFSTGFMIYANEGMARK